MPILDKIVDLVKAGPLLPAEIAAKVGLDSFFINAYLSQLVETGKLKASNTRVAGTPVYSIPGQESAAETRAKHIMATAQKTARTFAKEVPNNPEIQKKREEFAAKLQEIEAKEKETAKRKVIPVTINKLKDDFAFAPGKQAVGGEHKTKTEPKITYEVKTEPEQVIREPEQQKPAEAMSSIEGTVTEKPKRGRKKKEPVIIEDGKIVLAAMSFLVEAGAEIISKELKRNGKDADIKILLPTQVGNMPMLAIIREKKSITEADLSMAHTEGMNKKIPVLFLTNGNFTKTSKDYYETISGFLKFKTLNV
jgi:hypothetical protein